MSNTESNGRHEGRVEQLVGRLRSGGDGLWPGVSLLSEAADCIEALNAECEEYDSLHEQTNGNLLAAGVKIKRLRFVISALIAAGHVKQGTVDDAFSLARAMMPNTVVNAVLPSMSP